MANYLFTDGTGKVTETNSREELRTLAANATEPEKTRVWIFNSNEWISYPAFCKKYPETVKQVKTLTTTIPDKSEANGSGKKWLKKFLFAAIIISGAFLVFNFTNVKWEKAAPLSITAARPENVPVMDIDSLITVIEFARFKILDRSTRTNLRLRNTWPERIILQLNADRESSSAGSRFKKIEISIDNTTGYNVDNAVVKFQVWKNGRVNRTDTLQFSDIRIDKMPVRQLEEVIRGDSLSISFQSLKAKQFNFCYSSNTKNNSGNYNDRWFCPGGTVGE